MPSLNFVHEFAALVKSGEKNQTIRLRRKIPIMPGDQLYLYEGLRTKRATKLGESPCISTTPIQIDSCFAPRLGLRARILLDGRQLDREEELALILADGFRARGDESAALRFFSWFRNRYGFSFHGILTKWIPLA